MKILKTRRKNIDGVQMGEGCDGLATSGWRHDKSLFKESGYFSKVLILGITNNLTNNLNCFLSALSFQHPQMFQSSVSSIRQRYDFDTSRCNAREKLVVEGFLKKEKGR